MIGTIVKKEIAANLLSYKLFDVILLMTLLLFTRFFVLYRDFKARLADYQIIKPKRAEIAAIAWPDALILVIFGFVFFAGSYVAFLRYDVR